MSMAKTMCVFFIVATLLTDTNRVYEINASPFFTILGDIIAGLPQPRRHRAQGLRTERLGVYRALARLAFAGTPG